MDNRITQYLPRLPYWGNLTEAERDAVARHAVIRRYPAGSVLHSGGSACLGMIFVLGGSLRTYLLSEEGREITLFRLAAGDPCVLSAACVVSQLTFDTQMEAETDCDLLIVGAAVFKRLTEENIYVRCFLYELATERFSSVMWTMQQILFEKVDRRLAAFLLSESEKAGRLLRHLAGKLQAHDARGDRPADQLGPRGRRPHAQALLRRRPRRAPPRRRAAQKPGGAPENLTEIPRPARGINFFRKCDLVTDKRPKMR